MTLLTTTEARRNLGKWLKAAARGEQVGIRTRAATIALRPVAETDEEYVRKEYGLTPAEMECVAKRLIADEKKERKAGKIKRYSGNIEADCRD